MGVGYSFPMRQRGRSITRWLYIWRPLIVSTLLGVTLVWAVAYAYSVHLTVREQLAEEKALNVRLTEMVDRSRSGREFSIGFINSVDFGRAEIVLRPAAGR